MGGIFISENTINKARRFLMFNLSIFDCRTKEERKLYGELEKAKNEEKQSIKIKLMDAVRSFSGIRMIDKKVLFDSKSGEAKVDKLIAGFENEAVRLSPLLVYEEYNPKYFPLVREIIIMDCPGTSDKETYSWHEIMLEQIVRDGVMIDGEKFIVYSSSANQMKKRQVCLMKEQFFNDNQSRLMCGLTLDVINKKGGCNTGKYLAYTSLIFSKSVEMLVNINIDEVLILPEFETKVIDKVNYLDMESLTIEETTMPVPVNHMDGAGVFLPGIFPQSCQIRGGWIKGAVFPFDFRQFIIEKQKEGKVREIIKDAWGDNVSVDYVRDNIKIILNDSQLKMRKYYDSWEEYKQKFKENGLKICINNILHYPNTDDPIVLSAYQFYQTIPRENVTDERIEALTALTIETINDAKVNPDTALKIMGIDLDEAEELEPFYASIKAYPQMLQDPYVKRRIDSKIQSERKKAMSGRPYIKGYYNYICPDLYAACEYWFCGIDNPEGLIPKNHVYNALYSNTDGVTEVCCLRSPHLSDCEHGIRQLEKSDECKRWFSGMDTVISTHDLLTKVIQCDVDGDECLTTPDRAFIDLLDRDKLPLYYEMKKAEPSEVNKQYIFDCLMRSFKNEKIGDISNALTKHLNMAYKVDYEFVRIMTAYNNFCIDNPKSQYMPSLEKYQDMYCEWMERENPYFFKYAKQKETDKCCTNEVINKRSNVNRISKYIENNTKSNKNNIWRDSIDGKEFKPQYFMDSDVRVDRSSETYKALLDEMARLKANDNEKFREQLRKKYNASNDDKKLGYDVYYFYCNSKIQNIIKEYYSVTERIGYRRKAATYLVDIEYFQEENKESSKDILWNCFGDILYENLLYNLKVKPDELYRVKRNAYKKSEQLEKEIAEMIEAVQQERKNTYCVPIMDYEFEWIMGLSCRKGCERDQYLLYLLLVQYKREMKYLDGLDNQDAISKDRRKYVKIYKKSKYGKVTRTTFDKWLEINKRVTIADKGLKRFSNKELIVIKNCKKHDKVYLQLPEPKENGEIAFTVENKNPMIDFYLYTNDVAVKECVICHRLFPVADGNVKTCSTRCSRINELRNKNK